VADDIIARLRVNAEGAPTKNGGHNWLSLSPSTSAEAADLIEAQQAEIERLRAAGDELVASLTPVSFAGPHEDMNRLERAYLAWEEARRG
jgi:hypothetical protein